MKKHLLYIVALVLLTNITLDAQVVTSDSQLAYTKRNKDQIVNGATAYKSLIGRAKKELEVEIVPVTEKSIVAISGNPHDYVSMGPYWWPDESKPDGLPYIRRDGQRNPEGETLDRNKISVLCRTVSNLAYAYYFTGEERYAFKAVDNLKIWFLNEETKMNPHLNYGQMIPGRNNGMGRGTGIIDTYSFVDLVDCITILSSSQAMNRSDLKQLKQWFSDYVDWMLESDLGKDEKASKNNHGTAYDIQVAAYALFAGRKDIAKEYASNFLETRVFAQIEPDGKQPLELERTMAMHYSIFNVDHMLDMVAIGNKVGVKFYDKVSEDGRSIPSAIDYIVTFLGKSEADFPYQQFKDWDMCQEKICWLLRRASLVKKNKEYDKLFDQYVTTKASDLKWLFYAN